MRDDTVGLHPILRTAQIVDLAAFRAGGTHEVTKLDARPPIAADIKGRGTTDADPIGVGKWARTPDNLLVYVKSTYTDRFGVDRAIVTNGSGINGSWPIRCLTPNKGALPAPLNLTEGC